MRPIVFWPYAPEMFEEHVEAKLSEVVLVATGERRLREQTSALYERRGSTALDPAGSIGGVYEAVAKHCKIRVISGLGECNVELARLRNRGELS